LASSAADFAASLSSIICLLSFSRGQVPFFLLLYRQVFFSFLQFFLPWLTRSAMIFSLLIFLSSNALSSANAGLSSIASSFLSLASSACLFFVNCSLFCPIQNS
jgi:hypothetical protein